MKKLKIIFLLFFPYFIYAEVYFGSINGVSVHCGDVTGLVIEQQKYKEENNDLTIKILSGCESYKGKIFKITTKRIIPVGSKIQMSVSIYHSKYEKKGIKENKERIYLENFNLLPR